MQRREARSQPVTVLVLDRAADRYLAMLRTRFPEVRVVVCDTYETLPARLAEAQPEVVLSFKIGRAAFPREALVGSGARWIHAGGAGVDHLVPWDAARLEVTNSSGIHGDIMAQHVLCVVLMMNLHMPAYLRQQRERRWQGDEGISLEGQTLGVVGFGSVGQAVGRLARRAGMRVIGVRTRPAPSEAADEVAGVDALRRVAAEVDHLVVCLPLTPATRGLIDADVISAMRPHARLIDVSRGGVVDGDALLDALKAGAIAGAALDVFASEPLPPESPFWEMENVIVTPHVSSDIRGWQLRVAELFADNLERWLAARPLRNVVDPARGY